MWGMQLAIRLTNWSKECILFKLLVQALAASSFKDVRKRIIKSLRIDESDKRLIQSCLVPRLIDVDAEVRLAAYQKLKEFNFELADVQGEQACMTIIKEGMADTAVIANNLSGEANSIRNAYIDFITPTLYQARQVKLNKDQFAQLR